MYKQFIIKKECTMEQPMWQSRYFKRIYKTMFLVTLPVLLIALVLLYVSFYRSTLTYLNSVTQRLMLNTTSNIRYQTDCSKKTHLTPTPHLLV